MSAIDVIKGVMPIIKQAAETVGAFNGSAEEARGNSVIADALEILGAVAPLVDSFAHGMEVTPDDVRSALVGMDQALSDFDAEIARQGG